MPVPTPNSAVPIGRPIASTEPNAISRMIIAASSPMASLVPFVAPVWKMSPPSATCRPGDVDAVRERFDLITGVRRARSSRDRRGSPRAYAM